MTTTINTTKTKPLNATFRIDEQARKDLDYITEAGFSASHVVRKFLAEFVEKHKIASANK